MRYSQASQGRVFVIRLEHGDLIREELERFAEEKSISCAALIIHGGVDRDSSLVVTPKEKGADFAPSRRYVLNDAHEVSGTATLFPNAEGKPVLHMHIACGRSNGSVIGCVREGVKTWHVLEVILIELLDCTAVRKIEPKVGFELLQP